MSNPASPPKRMTEDQFCAKQAECLADIPEEFHAYFSYKAYEDGHSAGREEVIGCLLGLLDGFKEAVDTYTKRIKEVPKS